MLHELIYKEAISLGHRDSIHTRYFNSLVLTGRFIEFDQKEYVEILKLVKFKSYYIEGFRFDVSSPTSFHLNGRLSTGFLRKKGTKIESKFVDEKGEVVYFGFPGNEKTKLHLSETGELLGGAPTRGYLLKGFYFESDHSVGLLDFYVNGSLKSGKLVCFGHFKVQNKSISLAREVGFFRNGKLSHGMINSPIQLETIEGPKTFRMGAKIWLDENEIVIKWKQ